MHDDIAAREAQRGRAPNELNLCKLLRSDLPRVISAKAADEGDSLSFKIGRCGIWKRLGVLDIGCMLPVLSNAKGAVYPACSPLSRPEQLGCLDTRSKIQYTQAESISAAIRQCDRAVACMTTSGERSGRKKKRGNGLRSKAEMKFVMFNCSSHLLSLRDTKYTDTTPNASQRWVSSNKTPITALTPT